MEQKRQSGKILVAHRQESGVRALPFPPPCQLAHGEMGYGLVEPVGAQLQLVSFARKSPMSVPIFFVCAAPLSCLHLIPCAQAHAASASGHLCLKQHQIAPRRWLLSQGGGHTLIGCGKADTQPGNSTGRLGKLADLMLVNLSGILCLDSVRSCTILIPAIKYPFFFYSKWKFTGCKR